jgi:hypothetical protein
MGPSRRSIARSGMHPSFVLANESMPATEQMGKTGEKEMKKENIALHGSVERN